MTARKSFMILYTLYLGNLAGLLHEWNCHRLGPWSTCALISMMVGSLQRSHF